MLLMIDNYDSFTYNLVQYFGELGEDVRVVRNDEVTLQDIHELRPRQLVLSPGPCSPAEAGLCVDAIRHFTGRLPILGVCLGHQVIVEAFGGRVDRAGRPMHGKASNMAHDGTGLLAGLPNPLPVGRYHSLAAQAGSLPDCLAVQGTSPVLFAADSRGCPKSGFLIGEEDVWVVGKHFPKGSIVRLWAPTPVLRLKTMPSKRSTS